MMVNRVAVPLADNKKLTDREADLIDAKREEMERITFAASNLADYNKKSIVLRFLQALKGED